MQSKKTTKILLMLPIFFAVFLFTQNVFASEKINNFDVQITVEPAGTVRVIETIEYDFGDAQKHGIFRDIPMDNIYTIEHARLGGTRIEVGSVTDEKGNSYLRDVTDDNGIKHIKIGDPDKTITGVHKYIIDYTVTNALGYFTDYDEIYWNVTGNSWQVPILQASATVRLSGDVQGLPDKIQCYTGFEGEKNTCDSVIPYHYSSAQFVQNNIMPGQGLTVAVGFAKGLVPNYVYVAKWYNDPNNYYKIAFGVFILGLLLLLRKIFLVYIPEIREKTKPIVTQFEPPTNMTPSGVGYVYNKSLLQNNKSLAGDILYLATEGYITIENQPRTKIDASQVSMKVILGIGILGSIIISFYLGSFVPAIIIGGMCLIVLLINIFSSKSAFSKTQTVFVQTGKSITDAKDHLQHLYAIITNSAGPKTTDQLREEEPFFLFQEYFTLARSAVLGNDKNLNLRHASTVQEFAGNILTGFWQTIKAFLKFGFIIFGFIGIIVGSMVTSDMLGLPLLTVTYPFIALTLLIVINLITRSIYKKRLAKTSDEYYGVMGLRQYIKIAERDRLLFEQRPDDLPKLFSKLLPFAVALGLGDVWARAFNGLLTANPDWYHGTNNAFSSAAFASSISGLSSSISSASSSGAPSSDGGSGGGGSSGGGGGGGGGGSW